MRKPTRIVQRRIIIVGDLKVAESVSDAVAPAPVARPRKIVEPVIMVVDDDVGVSTAIKTILADDGMRCIQATSLQDAIEALDDLDFLGVKLDAIIGDINLPDGQGHRAVDFCLKRRPGVHAAVMTAYADDELLAWINDRKVLFLQKPFTVAALREWAEASRGLAPRR
jgi:DNA-binding NtrC family response regulator